MTTAEHTPWRAAHFNFSHHVIEAPGGRTICRTFDNETSDLIVRDHNTYPQHVALIGALVEATTKLVALVNEVREEQVSDSIFGTATPKGQEASRIYASRILTAASLIDDALEGAQLVLASAQALAAETGR